MMNKEKKKVYIEEMKNFFNMNNDFKGLILMLLGQLSFSINDLILTKRN